MDAKSIVVRVISMLYMQIKKLKLYTLHEDKPRSAEDNSTEAK